MNKQVSLAIHGGAGNILKANMSEAQEKNAKKALLTAINSGKDILVKGGSALDAVEESVSSMEANPLFNAGFGSVLNYDGIVEADACIMDGSNLSSGALMGVSRIEHPIQLARKVLEKSEHVLFQGDGAEAFAESIQFPLVELDYLITPERKEQLHFVKSVINDERHFFIDEFETYKYGTVGAVARDSKGNLAAATSTGGMVNKQFQRVGDSPLVGCGTYANNISCAVSCTGQGEYFIANNVAFDVHAMLLYKQMKLDDVVREVIHSKLSKSGGQGGLIAVDMNGDIAIDFNTPGMYRGSFINNKIDIQFFKETKNS
jgi:beta-aspartyl-peptidase (threonine type)